MIKLIQWLVNQHNKRAKPEDQIEVQKPEVFTAVSEAHINPKVFEAEDKDFLNQILAEKKYDLRAVLTNELHKANAIEEEVEKKDNSVIIKLKLKVFKK